MNPFRNFDIDRVTAKISTFSLNVHDFRMVSPTLARVVLSYTGEMPADSSTVHNQIANLFQGEASAVVGSFSQLTKHGDLKSLIGFVKASREVIPYEDAAVTAGAEGKYKAMASNLLMDKSDESMWEIRSGATGKYLAKQAHSDLSELVHMATANVHGLPRFTQIASVPVATTEFASFVDVESEDVMSGFVVASTENLIKVFCFETQSVVEAGYDQLVEVVELDAQEAKIKDMEMTKEVASDESTMIEYYRKAYSYAPEYVNLIIDMIRQHRFA
jgi:hypothetical protein